VFAGVEENVADRVTDFARRLQVVAVIAVAKELTAAMRELIHRHRDA